MVQLIISQMKRRSFCLIAALHYASKEGSLEITKALLKSDTVDINTVSNAGTTALLEACRCGQNDIVKVLVKKGASTTIVDKDRR